MNTNSWKWFRYEDLFMISGSKTTPVEELEAYGKGEFPYVTTQAVNNGIEGYYNYWTEKGGVLTVDSAVLGFCAYQEKNFSASDHVEVLTPKFKMNKYIALFFATIINREQYRYSYGRKCSQIKMKKALLKLPVTPEGTPDWQYMETFVKDQIIPQLPKKAQKIWLQKYDTKPQREMRIKLNADEWKWFNYTDLFRISGSKTTPLEDLEGYGKGEYPYVTTQAVNNGVEGYFNYRTEKGGVLTVDSAVLGFCSYQEKDFSASDHVEVLTPLFKMNSYIALFLTTIINKEQYRYSYGRKCSQIKLKRSKIKLPVTPEGTPDWQYMEDYIKSLPYSRNLEPSKPDEVVDELVEMKKEMIKMRRAMEAQQPGSLVNYGTVNIYEK